MPFLPEPLRAGQVDAVVSAGGDGDVFEPRFTTHGFQYVRVEGHPGPLTADDVTGVVVHTDLRRRGWFTCSDERINRLHEAAVWSFRGNACDIPTDCPTRERAGWTGDWQLYVPTATFLYDVAGFSAKWLRDLAVGQWADGTIGNMAPMPAAERTASSRRERLGGLGRRRACWCRGSSTRSTATSRCSRSCGRRWCAGSTASSGWPRQERHPTGSPGSAEPAPHERYLWDTGFHWGEWLEPGGEPHRLRGVHRRRQERRRDGVLRLVAPRHAARIAALLGQDDEADAVRRRSATAVVDAWRAEFVDADGRVKPHTQANLVRALRFGLVPDELRQQAADDLVELVRDGRHPPRHRLPRDARPAAGAGRRRPPRRRLRAAVPGHRAVVADDDRPRRHHRVGALEGHRRGRRAARVAQPLLQGRGRSRSCTATSPASSGSSRPGAGSGCSPAPVAGSPRRRPTHETPHGAVAVAWRLRRRLRRSPSRSPPGCTAEVVLPDGDPSRGRPRHARLRRFGGWGVSDSEEPRNPCYVWAGTSRGSRGSAVAGLAPRPTGLSRTVG